MDDSRFDVGQVWKYTSSKGSCHLWRITENFTNHANVTIIMINGIHCGDGVNSGISHETLINMYEHIPLYDSPLYRAIKGLE
jgi:hypothetical protein